MTQTPYEPMSTPTWGLDTTASGHPTVADRLDPAPWKFAGRKREVTVRIDYCSGTIDDGEDGWRRVLEVLRQLHPEFIEQSPDHDARNTHYDWSRSFVVKGTGAVIATISSGRTSNRTDLRVHVTAKGDRGGVLFKALRIAGVGWSPSRIDVALDVVGDLEYYKRKRLTFDGKLPKGREATRIGPRSGVDDPGLTWTVGMEGAETTVRWYRKGRQSGGTAFQDVNRLEFQFRPQDQSMRRALAGCNDPLEIIAMAGPKWVRDLAAELIGDKPMVARVVARVVASPVAPPRFDDRKWKEFLKQNGPMLYRLAWLLNPDDPLSGLIVMWRDIVAAAAYSAARKSGKAGRNPVWEDPRETAFSAKSPDRSRAPATVLQAPAQPAPEHPPHQMVAVPEPVGPERSGVVPNPGAGRPLPVSVERSNRGVRWLFMDGWVNPAKADPGRVLRMMGLIHLDRPGNDADRGIRRIRRARAAG